MGFAIIPIVLVLPVLAGIVACVAFVRIVFTVAAPAWIGFVFGLPIVLYVTLHIAQAFTTRFLAGQWILGPVVTMTSAVALWALASHLRQLRS